MSASLVRPYRSQAWVAALVAAAVMHASTGHAADPALVPLFRIRGRVDSSASPPPDGRFTIALEGQPAGVECATGEWSPWLELDKGQAQPLAGAKRFTVAVRQAADSCRMSWELKFDEREDVIRFTSDQYGPSLGLFVSRGLDGRPDAVTTAAYNRRYWAAFDKSPLTGTGRIRKIPVIDRFIAGDQDWATLREGIGNLSRAGVSALMTGPDARARQVLGESGLTSTAWAVYCPPGGVFDHRPDVTPESTATWARAEAEKFAKAGFAPRDMAIFALADEPGWYFPACIRTLLDNPAAVRRFREYLRDRGLRPEDVGATTWDAVVPLGRAAPGDPLPARRLFYWTTRFFSWDSARYHATCTRALESAFYEKLPVFVNWNFFSGRYYVPGPVANNPDRSDPAAAMGGHDWFEFARERGATMLWTEDWFPDQLAYNWSYHCARMRSAARLGGIEFGGYVVPRTAGGRADGLAQKVAAILAHGGKGIKYFVFGPEYAFPGNCYSENLGLLWQFAEVHQMVARAEHLLWPGRPLPASVAILMPRSSMAWDGPGASDATNFRLNNQSVDYLIEVYNQYLAYMHANIPVDFVDEDQLTADGLKGVRVLVVTEPDVPEEGQRAVVEWVRQGGTLVTVPGAAGRDRYDEPCDVLRQGVGIREPRRERLMIPNVYALPGVGSVKFGDHLVHAIGIRSAVEGVGDEAVRLRFTDDRPALVANSVGKGRAWHYAWMPGVSYAQCPGTKYGMLVDWKEPWREAVLLPAREAGVVPTVRPGRPMIEAPLLVSDDGGVVTLFNWTGDFISHLPVEMDWRRPLARVRSVRRGVLPHVLEDGVLRFTHPMLEGVDFVLLESK